MVTNTSNFTVAEYCQQMNNSDIVVNREYQRSNAVWPLAAKAYLIDTILSGYPISKLALYQKTDLRSRRTIKEIVDGQQRSQTILDFYEYKLRITGKSQFAGHSYSTLEPDLQRRFIEYVVSVDVFVGATDPEIREVFRRMNSYTVPLNKQEHRHSTFQGSFKWFIIKMSGLHAQSFKDLGVFTEHQLSRMQDAAFLTEVCYALEIGIENSVESKLDAFYKSHDVNLDERWFESKIGLAMDCILEWRGDLKQTSHTKQYNFYSLLLAICHIYGGPIDSLDRLFAHQPPVDRQTALANLGRLENAMENFGSDDLTSFRYATMQGTNRIGPRTTRFEWYCRALTQTSVG